MQLPLFSVGRTCEHEGVLLLLNGKRDFCKCNEGYSSVAFGPLRRETTQVGLTLDRLSPIKEESFLVAQEESRDLKHEENAICCHQLEDRRATCTGPGSSL